MTTIWATGDYPTLAAELIAELGPTLVDACAVEPGQRVLDVAAGSGNAAIPAALRGAEVTASDVTPELLAAGERLAAQQDAKLTWQEADAQALPYADNEFDTVMSCVGVMFAPRHQDSADELVRVCRPGGRVGMANWTPDGFWGESFALLARYIPPAAGLRSPTEWGTKPRLDELFSDKVSAMRVERRSALFRYRSNAHWIEVFRSCFGPIIRTLENLDQQRRAAYLSDLDALLTKFNRSNDSTLVLSADYLEVVMVKNP